MIREPDVRTIVRRRLNGDYEAGLSILGCSWSWKRLKARRKDTAAKEARAALAELLLEASIRCENVSRDFSSRSQSLALVAGWAAEGRDLSGVKLSPIPDNEDGS